MNGSTVNKKAIKEKNQKNVKIQGGCLAEQCRNSIIKLIEKIDDINILIKIFTFVKAWME